MKKEIYLKKSTRDAIKKNMKDDYSNYNKDYGFIGNAIILNNPNNLPKVGDKDSRYTTPAKVTKVKKIDNKNGYDIYRVTYQEVDSISLGEDVDTYHFDYAIKKTTKDSYEDLGWISDYDLLKEDDFYDPSMLQYWIEEMTELNKQTTLLSKQRIALKLLNYIDDFKNKYVKEEVKGDLERLINKKDKVRDSKIKDYGLENIKIPGYRGTWYEIDKKEVKGKTYYLLEHEYYGDETAHLFVEKVGSTFKVLDDESYDLSINELIRDFA